MDVEEVKKVLQEARMKIDEALSDLESSEGSTGPLPGKPGSSFLERFSQVEGANIACDEGC